MRVFFPLKHTLTKNKPSKNSILIIMELNSKSLGAFKRLADETTLTDDDFAAFASAIFDSYTVNINTGTFQIDTETTITNANLESIWKNKTKKSTLELKETVAAFHMLVAELARHNTDKSSSGLVS